MIVYNRNRLELPLGAGKLLLHSCCAPCSGEIMETLNFSGIPYTLLFYNPNIHPLEEYNRRKDEISRFAGRMGVPFADLDYEVETWKKAVRGLEQEPEKGKRCQVCFSLRLGRTAQYAHEQCFPVFATTLAISRWKDLEQVNNAGMAAAGRFPGLVFWGHNWRKQGGALRNDTITQRENFYRQKYCGCVYSF